MTATEVERRRPTGYQSHRTTSEIEAEALEVMRLKVLGWSDVAIGKQLSMARATVTARLRYAVETHGKQNVEEYREIAKQRYEAAISALGPMIAEGNLDAIKTWLDATAKYAKLVGAEAPVQVAMEVTQVTEQEKALREMLAQAERDEKARETVIVEGQVVDEVVADV